MQLHALQHTLRPLLTPFSHSYASLMKMRRYLYTHDMLSSFSSACPCIAIGNISWGGTGKTPMTGWFLNWASKHALKAVVLSRGYKSDVKHEPLLVTASTSIKQAGDEPALLARKYPHAEVIVYPHRKIAAQFALKNNQPDVFILDDGMQHLAMKRDADIVLLTPEDLTESWNCVIPAGSWREGKDALKAATVFCIKCPADQFHSLQPIIEKRLSVYRVPIFSFHLAATGLYPLHHADKPSIPSYLPSEQYMEKPYILLSGVGKPDQVEATARSLMKRPPEEHVTFADHHAYLKDDILPYLHQDLPVICTEKDAVKLQELQLPNTATSLWVMSVEVQFGPSLYTEHSFATWWHQWWTTQTKTTVKKL